MRWARPASPAGCYCEPASRQHKWGLVLEDDSLRAGALIPPGKLQVVSRLGGSKDQS